MGDHLSLDEQHWLLLLQTTGSAAASRRSDAWERFYRQYDPFVRATVSACRVPSADFNDAAQDAWMELARALPDLRLDSSRGSLLAWMRTVVNRITRDGLRRKTPAARESHNAVKASCDPNMHTSDAECERRETRAAVRIALKSFRSRTSRLNYRVLALISIDGLTAEETAHRLNLTVPQVWSRHHRVKCHFRRFLQHRGFPEGIPERSGKSGDSA